DQLPLRRHGRRGPPGHRTAVTARDLAAERHAAGHHERRLRPACGAAPGRPVSMGATATPEGALRLAADLDFSVTVEGHEMSGTLTVSGSHLYLQVIDPHLLGGSGID